METCLPTCESCKKRFRPSSFQVRVTIAQGRAVYCCAGCRPRSQHNKLTDGERWALVVGATKFIQAMANRLVKPHLKYNHLEDAFQVGLLEAYKSAKYWVDGGGRTFYSFIRMPIKTAIVRYILKEAKRQDAASSYTMDEITDSVDSFDIVDRRDLPESVIMAMSRLPKKHHDAIKAVYIDGCSQSQAAKKLQEPFHRTRGFVRDGLNNLRAKLAKGA